jgi:ribose 5-phosphate isomerase A
VSDSSIIAKRAAAVAALELVEPGMKLGLGTGSTVSIFVDLLGERMSGGFHILAVPTSERTARQARTHEIPLFQLDEIAPLDLTIDGADEIAPDLSMIKGGGGAHLREKIVASASKRMVVIADQTKCVKVLGAFDLPVEIVQFAHATTMDAIAQVLPDFALATKLTLRTNVDNTPFVSDGNNYIVDCACECIESPSAAAAALSTITGVVEHGLFVDIASEAIIGHADGTVEWIG